MEKKLTGYDWCLEYNIRVLNINEWPRLFEGSAEKGYFQTPIENYLFLNYLTSCKIKDNSTPRKTEKYLELRMYTLVPYNLAEIQKGIQHEHSTTS